MLVEPTDIRPFLRRAAEAEGAWVRSAADDDERAAMRVLLTHCGDLDPAAVLVLVLVASPHDLPVCQLRAGRAVQRVLLTASALGYAGAVVAGRGGLDLSPRSLAAAGLHPGAVPQAMLSIGPAAERLAPVRVAGAEPWRSSPRGAGPGQGRQVPPGSPPGSPGTSE